MRRRFAPRISPRLLAEIERLAAGDLHAAEIARRVGETAVRLGLPRPSYQRVRVLVREIRDRPWGPTTGDVIAEVAVRVRPPSALYEHSAGDLPRTRRRS